MDPKDTIEGPQVIETLEAAGMTVLEAPGDQRTVALHPETETRDVDRSKHTATVVFSTGKFCARDGCVLESRGVDMKAFRKNPVVLWGHDHSLLPIASSPKVKFVDEGKGKLVGFPKFHMDTELSREVWALMEKGVLRAWSLGFIPTRIKKLEPKEVGIKPISEDDSEAFYEGTGELDLRAADVRYRILKSELLEYSSVAVPADSSALTEGIRALHEGGRSAPRLEEILRAAGFAIPELVPQRLQTEEGIVIEFGPLPISRDEAEETQDPIKVSVTGSVEFAAEERIEETEDFIHVPVRDADNFIEDSLHTIAISKKAGISAVAGQLTKDGSDGAMTIQKYLFAKAKGWTAKKATKWVSDHKKALSDWFSRMDAAEMDPRDFEFEECNGLVPVLTNRGVIPFHAYGTAEEDTDWDAGSEVKAASIEELHKMSAWYKGEGEAKGDYKFPHHRQSDIKAVWKAVINAVARLSQAKISDKDKKGVLKHLHGHYKEFGKEVPESKSVRAGKVISNATAKRLASSVERLQGVVDDLKGLSDLANAGQEPKEPEKKSKAAPKRLRGKDLESVLRSGR